VAAIALTLATACGGSSHRTAGPSPASATGVTTTTGSIPTGAISADGQTTGTSGPATSTTAAAPATSAVPAAPVTSATQANTGTAAPATSTAAAFVGTVASVTAADVPYSWRPGCPVGPGQLRLLHLSYWGFDGVSHVGTMVVNAVVTADVLKIFGQLYAVRFPIHQMQPVDAYRASDPDSMAADNTSGFNCRNAVAPGAPQWSVHAFGEAIDVNPVENPDIQGGTVTPAAGTAFLNRSDVRPGMAVPSGPLVQAFASAGWQWGGRWTASPDYQHFSRTGG
jgi:hypothetical protein